MVPGLFFRYMIDLRNYVSLIFTLWNYLKKYMKWLTFKIVNFSCFSDSDWKSDQHNPEELASFPSVLFFSWMDSLFKMGFKTPLIKDNLPRIPDRLVVRRNVIEFTKYWLDRLHKKRISFSSRSSERPKVGIWSDIKKKYFSIHFS